MIAGFKHDRRCAKSGLGGKQGSHIPRQTNFHSGLCQRFQNDIDVCWAASRERGYSVHMFLIDRNRPSAHGKQSAGHLQMFSIGKFAWTDSGDTNSQQARRVRHGTNHWRFQSEGPLDVSGGNGSRHRNKKLAACDRRLNLHRDFFHHLRFQPNQNDIRIAHRSDIVSAHGNAQFFTQTSSSLFVSHREIKEIVTPTEVLTDPDVNVVAAELIRDIESQSRREKLETVVRLRSRLNPTIRKKLILALKNSTDNAAQCEAQLSKDFEDYPANGKAFQRVIRERMAKEPDPLLAEKEALAKDFTNASVREISLADARNLIVANEWLGNLGSVEHAWGLFFGEYLAGVVCFGSTAGTKVRSSVCGAEHADKVVTLVRGCCLPFADPPRISSDGRTHGGSAASFLVSAACREMTKKGYNVFVAYADPQAGEKGVIFRACNFLYCGPTSPTEKFRRPDGKVYDARNVHLLTRDRRFGRLRYKRSRAEQKQLLIEQGCEFFKDTGYKHRFVEIFGDRRLKRILRRALRWNVMEYSCPMRSECRKYSEHRYYMRGTKTQWDIVAGAPVFGDKELIEVLGHSYSCQQFHRS